MGIALHSCLKSVGARELQTGLFCVESLAQLHLIKY